MLCNTGIDNRAIVYMWFIYYFTLTGISWNFVLGIWKKVFPIREEKERKRKKKKEREHEIENKSAKTMIEKMIRRKSEEKRKIQKDKMCIETPMEKQKLNIGDSHHTSSPVR